MKVILGLFLLLTGDSPKVEVDPKVLQALNVSNESDIICILKSPWEDVGQVTRSFETKTMKGSYLFNRLNSYAIATQKNIITHLEKDRYQYRSFYIVNAIHIPHASSDLVEFLSSQSEVKRIEYNSNYALVKPHTDELDVSSLELRNPTAVEWGITRIQGDSLWDLGFKGKGVVIGGEDTGVELHPAIKNSYRGTISGNQFDHNYNWHDAIHALHPLNRDVNNNEYNNPCGLDTIAPCDDNNHGTHTVGTMAATDMQTGVAPEAQWIACRCMERGWGTFAQYIECFQWFLAPTDTANKNPDPRKSPHVINNSWGCPTEEGCNPANFKTMEQVISTLKAAGIFVTVSAGNSGAQGCNSIDDPAAIFEPSFTVGASGLNDSIASFSSRGPVTIDSTGRIKPNIVAPGVAVRSTIKNGGFASTSGTSMSGPHVCGAVALLISAFPQLAGKVELLEEILEQSADKKLVRIQCGKDSATAIPNNTYGYGRLNVYKAYLLAKQMLTTSIKNEPKIRLNVFPNPTDESIWFELAPNNLAQKVQVFNAQGQQLFLRSNIHQSSFNLDLTILPTGIYYYRLYTQVGVQSGKLIKS